MIISCKIFGSIEGVKLKENKTDPVSEFKEFERRFKFKPRLKYGWFHLKCFKILTLHLNQPEMEFKEFEPRFKSAKIRQNPV